VKNAATKEETENFCKEYLEKNI